MACLFFHENILTGMATVTSFTSPANGTAAIYTLLSFLCSNGWLVKAWSDATTLTSGVSLSSNPYGSSSSGAGNLGNTSAWFRISAPDASREWLFQRGSGDATWTVSRGVSGFSGGSPSATVVGTDSTGQNLLSAGTLFDSTPGRWSITLDSASPYGFFCSTVVIGGGNVRTVLFDEPLISGTYPSSDADPVMFGLYYNATGLAATGAFISTNVTVYKRFRHGLSSPSNVQSNLLGQLLTGVNTQVSPPTGSGNQIGVDPYNTQEIPIPICACKAGAASTSTGWIGVLKRMRGATVHGRSNGQTLYDATNTLYWYYVAGIWVPWDSSTPAI